MPASFSMMLSSLRIAPASIAGGIGLAGRVELCGFIAMLEAAATIQIVRGAVGSVAHRLNKDLPATADRVRNRARELEASSISDACLRHRLWRDLSEALGADAGFPLSVRRARTAANGIGFKAADRLSPGVRAARHKRMQSDGAGWNLASLGESALETLKTLPQAILVSEPPLPFPEVVAHEMAVILEGLDHGALEQAYLDPAVAKALGDGRTAALAAIAAGGGWAAFAAGVSSAGFAPYIVAAQLSAFIPFLSGPVATSLLATLVNPFTVVLGIAAIGGFAAIRGGGAVRADIAARVTVLLAVRGLENPDDGIARLVSAFRYLGLGKAGHASHLDAHERDAMRSRLAAIEERLGGPLPDAHGLPPDPWRASRPAKRPGDHDQADVAIVAALTAGDMLYHAAAIDPRVLAGADFSRAADIGDPFTFAACAGDFATRGAFANLQGYTAEQVVLSRLIEDGHDVALAITSNTPGYDLLVDGEAVQVKCGQSLDLLRAHFDQYPDVPVIADAGLAEMAAQSGAAWSTMVSTVDGFTLESVRTIVADTLAAAHGMADANVPVFAMAVGVARGVHGALSGAIPIEDLPASIALDVLIRGLLSSTGSQVGAAVGLVAIGPAGAIILGPVVAVASLFGTGTLRNQAVNLIHTEWMRALANDGAQLHGAYITALQRQAARLAERRRRFGSESKGFGPMRDWIDARAADDAVAAIEALLDAPPPPRSPDAVVELALLASQAAPADAAVLRARAAVMQRLQQRPSMTGAVGAMISRHLPSRSS